MSFKRSYRLFYACLFVLLSACSDAENETNLVNLHTLASLDIIAISFPADTTETTLSINSEYDFSLQGLKSNGVDLVAISSHIQWSLSEGAASTIDRHGHFTASDTAEFITLTAQLGFLSASIDITVSAAKFDRVEKLDEQAFGIDMCRPRTLTPVGRYVDEFGNVEIRRVDSTIINTIEWLVLDQEDNNVSQRAYIEKVNDQPVLNTLAAGDIIVRARAMSLDSGDEVTVDFNQMISAGLNSIKLCRVSDSDLDSCSVTSASIEKDKSISLIAVGEYRATDGSDFTENISRNSKWGTSNVTNASIAFSADRQQLDVTGRTELSSASVSVTCGNIEQSLDNVDISQGVAMDSLLSCGSNPDCLAASVSISIDQLSVVSFEVSANDIDLNDNESVSLSVRPDEISLVAIANYSNSSQAEVTTDVVYTIIPIDGQPDVIESKDGSSGIFTVLGAGTAKIQLNYRGESFVAVVIVP